MQHRHIRTDDWTLMAIESLLDRGQLSDWREFVQVMKSDPQLAERMLQMARGHEDVRSAALARMLIAHFHPSLREIPPV